MNKILLAVCGKTPQIIMETLYALWEKNDLPNSVIILTTKPGKDALISALLDPEHGIFYKFCAEYDINPEQIDFSWKNIIVPRNKSNIELEDILHEEDSSIFLKHCLEQVFKATTNAKNTVFFSIAAGRKTMGASLTLAAQFYGRAQDRIFHVLVHSDFEYSPYFYYPPKKPEVIELKDSKGEIFHKSTKYATISLVNIPFFSIRERLSNEMLAYPVLPEEILSQIKIASSSLLRLNTKQCTIEWNTKILKIQPAWFTIYLYFVQKKKSALDEFNKNLFTVELEEFLDNSSQLAKAYHEICRFMPQKEIPKSDTGILALNQDNFRSYKSKINKELLKAFGTNGCKDIFISSFGKKPNTRYGISLPATCIEIINE